MSGVEIKKGTSNRVTVTFPYNLSYVEKVKTIKGHHWHPEGKYWSFPDKEGIVEEIVLVFEGEKIKIDPALLPLKDIIGLSGGFEDLRRELVSRKYSLKTIKAYIHYNGDFLKVAGKSSADVTQNGLKDYLLYLAEEKQAVTSMLN